MRNNCRKLALPVLTALLVSRLLNSSVCAYNPPVDTAGPLVMRVEGPNVVTKTDEPLAVPRTTCH